MIGVRITLSQMMAHEELTRNEIIVVSQDGNREWISLLVAIYVVPAIISLTLIYQGESDDLRSIQIDNIDQNKAYFAVILIGLSNNKIGKQ